MKMDERTGLFTTEDTEDTEEDRAEESPSIPRITERILFDDFSLCPLCPLW
jgi:hypothetical protein